jgi:hypothetical protein
MYNHRDPKYISGFLLNVIHGMKEVHVMLYVLHEFCTAVHAGQKEKLWREFFSDPSQWWDNRSEKVRHRVWCKSQFCN